MFIAACSVLLVVVVVRVDMILAQVDTSPLTAHMHSVMNEAFASAEESHVFGAELRQTLAQTAPALLRAVNASNDLIARFDSFSHHPALTITAGR